MMSRQRRNEGKDLHRSNRRLTHHSCLNLSTEPTIKDINTGSTTTWSSRSWKTAWTSRRPYGPSLTMFFFLTIHAGMTDNDQMDLPLKVWTRDLAGHSQPNMRQAKIEDNEAGQHRGPRNGTSLYAWNLAYHWNTTEEIKHNMTDRLVVDLRKGLGCKGSEDGGRQAKVAKTMHWSWYTYSNDNREAQLCLL
jgi:hypothetical protein